MNDILLPEIKILTRQDQKALKIHEIVDHANSLRHKRRSTPPMSSLMCNFNKRRDLDREDMMEDDFRLPYIDPMHKHKDIHLYKIIDIMVKSSG